MPDGMRMRAGEGSRVSALQELLVLRNLQSSPSPLGT